MKLSNKITGLILALIVVLSLGVSTLFMLQKQGYHEDELLTYNLANSSSPPPRVTALTTPRWCRTR